MLSLNSYQGLSEKDLGSATGTYGNLAGSAGGVDSTIGSNLWSGYKAFGAPVVAGLSLAAMGKPDYASQAAVTAAQQGQGAADTAKRNLFRMGVNPNSGRFAGVNREASLATAAAKTGAVTAANRASNEDHFKNLLSTAGIMSSMPGQALQAESQQAGQAETGAMGLTRSANDYGDLASAKAQSDSLAAQLQTFFGGQSQDNPANSPLLKARLGGGGWAGGGLFAGGGLSSVPTGTY